MENHPIPQDITGFQFKLIGNMTVKQFAYLGSGVTLAWLTFYFPIYVLVKWPLMAAFAGIGAALAFLPIAGRPLDVMVAKYFKAIFSPTQYVYAKSGGHLWYPSPKTVQKKVDVQNSAQEQNVALKDFLSSLPKLQKKSALDDKEKVYFESVNNLLVNPSAQTQLQVQAQAAPSANAPHRESAQPPKAIDDTPDKEVKEAGTTDDARDDELKREALLIQQKLAEAQKQEASQVGTVGYEQAHLKVTELQKTLSDTMLQKQELEKQLLALQKQLTDAGKDVYRPSVAHPAPITQNVRSIPVGMTKGVGLPPSPEFPNIITGIVKDSRDNPLANILVEVKDKEGNPVRAFKTNALGHFASATPLANGTYRLEFEDPKEEHRFDVTEFVVTGEIILPVEVISVDKREDLRRELFKN